MLINPVIYLIDDKVNYFLVKTILEDVYPAFQLIWFHDAEAGLRTFMKAKNLTGHFQAFILLDLFLPKKDGWYFVEHYEALVSSSFPVRNIFILTCSTYSKDLEKAQKYKCIADVLIKPFTKELVKNKLAPFLEINAIL